MKVKVINRKGFLFLVGENGEDLGAQTDISINNSTTDKGRLKVSVEFILDFEDIQISEQLKTFIITSDWLRDSDYSLNRNR